jgi:probable HAF family extracellular repeat protein
MQQGVLSVLGFARDGDVEGNAIAINNSGVVVGSEDAHGEADAIAFVYRDGAMFDLNTVVDANPQSWRLAFTSGISDDGTIIGTAIASDGSFHAFKLAQLQ